jgi:hypothetical protein
LVDSAVDVERFDATYLLLTTLRSTALAASDANPTLGCA